MLIWSNEEKNIGKGNAKDPIQSDVRKVLERFQEGYSKRDLSKINSYMEELFSEDRDALIVGTADSEWEVS